MGGIPEDAIKVMSHNKNIVIILPFSAIGAAKTEKLSEELLWERQ